jgi:hypothetical protein
MVAALSLVRPVRRVSHPLAGVVLLLLACGDGSGPSDLVGTYDLTSVNLAPPPALVQATVNCDVYLDGATAELQARTFSLDFQQTTDCTRTGGSQTVDNFGLSGTYAVVGNQVTFTITGLTPLTGTVSGDRVSTTIPATPWTFPNPVAVVFARRP